ncbi:MAG: N-acetylmuramoyl-L-alanine amidase, partial [Anaerolineae bacterium]|nr:N-acetylmuramoyl-L-alanine amidase [Anaerolineae bacterium]
MPRPLCDSPYIFGIHEEGGERYMLAKGKPGWIVFTEELGADPNNHTGRDYRKWSDQGLGVIVRLNHGYEPNGTIPHSSRYADFAQRCANFVAASQGAHIWIIGNEPNLSGERPGVRRDFSTSPAKILDPGEVITPQLYVRCYRLCRDAIKKVAGHEHDQVCVAAVAPWNAETQYPGNETGDWVVYLEDVLRLLGPDECDGITLHTYTHGPDPRLIYSEARMGPPFQNRYYNFYAYRDFMNAIPASMRHLPVYITETDQNEPWADVNSGWVRNAYAEINWWNQQPGHQQIRLLALYRWPDRDQWVIEGKQGVIDDFLMALDNDYRWKETPALQPYAVSFLSHDTPTEMEPGEIYTVHFRLKNAGSRTWQHDGDHPVHVGYHWYDGDGNIVLLPPEHDIRSELPSDVASGETVNVEARVAAPQQEGTFRLEWDLVEEGVTWFRDRDSKPLSVTVKVEIPKEYFKETGQWVKGRFLDFLHEKGVDVIGLPVSPQFLDPDTGLQTQYFERVALELADGQVRMRPTGEEAYQARQKIAELKQHVDELSQEIDRLRHKLEQSQPVVQVPRPEIEDVIDELDRDPDGFVKRPLERIRYLVFNHTAKPATTSVEQLAAAHRQRGLPGFAGQFLITGDGRILQTEPLDEVVDGQQTWSMDGINIYVAGNFMDKPPTAAQIEAAA